VPNNSNLGLMHVDGMTKMWHTAVLLKIFKLLPQCPWIIPLTTMMSSTSAPEVDNLCMISRHLQVQEKYDLKGNFEERSDLCDSMNDMHIKERV